MSIIEKCPDKPWDWNGISKNPAITIDIIKSYPDKPWNWFYISQNPNLTIDFIESYPDKPWNWYHISYNKGITDKSMPLLNTEASQTLVLGSSPT